MGKITIALTLSEEKLEALNRYLVKKNEALEEKLGEQALKLYAATVPAAVRDYLDEKDGAPLPDSAAPKAKTPAKRREREPASQPPADTPASLVTQ